MANSKRLLLTVVCVLTFCGSASANLSMGLIAHYPLDGNAKDATMNGNDCTVNGATLTTDRFGRTKRAYLFDGVGDNLSCGDSAILDFGEGNFTISLWVNYKSNTGEQVLVEKFTGQRGPGWSFTKLSTQRYRFCGAGCTAPGVSCVDSSVQSLSPLTWHHLAVTRNGKDFTIYLDGRMIGFRSDLLGNFSTANPLLVGRRNPLDTRGFYMNGKLDDIRIYNRALSKTEIVQLFELRGDVEGCLKVVGAPSRNRKVILRQVMVPDQVTYTDINGCYVFEHVVEHKAFNVIIQGPYVQ